jgi:hypothetical protein
MIGWAGMSDWLGTGKRRRGLGWRPFRGARAYVRGLGLKSQRDWSDYCKSGKKPNDIPVHPEQIYAKADWVGLAIGSGLARWPHAYVNIDPSKRPTHLCAASG